MNLYSGQYPRLPWHGDKSGFLHKKHLNFICDDNLPWHMLADFDAVYFVSGDEQALRYARQAKIIVSTARILPLLRSTNIELDALVRSKSDKNEIYKSGDLMNEPKFIVTTEGINGGHLSDGVRYEAVELNPQQIVDTYGCGDSFAAGLTYGLGSGLGIEEALRTATSAGASAAKRRGAFGM